MRKVITRFPPSPTGNLHLGSARTALFNFLYAKHHKGQMRFRFEDTDKERSKKEFEEDILQGLSWLGIEFDGEIWRQSERVGVYKKYLKSLLDKGLAYEAEENKDRTGKVIRFKNPNRAITFKDSLRGEIKSNITDLGDFVIARSIDEPLYHLTVVVDDYEMGVTDIIRGEDGLSNTARQIALQEALGFERPNYTHIPFILGPDKKKLSKRHGAKSVLEYKKEGYLKEALINFLALLGWRSKKDDEKELWSLDELIAEFDLDGFQKAPAVFNEEKLRWLNREYLKKSDKEEIFNELLERIKDADLRAKIQKAKYALIDDLLDRIHVYSDIEKMYTEGEFDYLIKSPDLDAGKLIWKKSNKEKTINDLKEALYILCDARIDDRDPKRVENILMPLAQKLGVGDLLWPIRYALSGKDKSASPFVLFASLGQDESCRRIKRAIDILENS